MDNALSLLLELASTNSQSVDSVARLLSAAKVRTVKSGAKPFKLADGGGLVLNVTPSGTKSWRYRFRLSGKEQTLTIGNYPEVSLEEARQAHRAARWLVERGHAPLVYLETQLQSRSDAKALAERHSFDAVCRDWLAATKGNLSSTTVRHRQQMLDKHVLPILGKRPIAAITRKELRDLLLGIDKDAPVTARHCRIYIKQVFDWALDAELVQGSPVPKATSLPNQASRRSVPRKALPVSALGSFLRTIEDAKTSDVLTRTALWLLVLTWSRTAEVIGAKWSEFDLVKGVWTIPAERMKAREAHVVYLSAQAITRVKALKKLECSDYLFPNRRDPKRAMGRMTLSAWRERWGFAETMEIHGLRAVASTWANEAGRYRPDVIEAALAHKEGDRVRAAYNRAAFANERRAMLQAWADECDRLLELARVEVKPVATP